MTQRMWSPWRSEYVEQAARRSSTNDTEHSLFAQLEREHRDEENLILWRGEHVFVIMNRYPYNNGHLLVLPYREVQDYDALTTEERHALADALDRCVRWLRRALDPDGFNVGMNLGMGAGAGHPEHLHAHVVPRWQGDTNFMTTTDETRVIPEAMEKTYQKLRAAVEASRDTPSPDA